MAKLVGYQLSWVASPSTDVAAYKIYWNQDGSAPDYTSVNFNCGNVVQIDVNQIPGFPLFEGNITLGLTAVDSTGNESDMVLKQFTLDRTAPQPPTNFVLVIIA